MGVIDVHPGKVEIRGTTNDALNVTGGMIVGGPTALQNYLIANGSIVSESTEPQIRLQDTDADPNQGTWRLRTSGADSALHLEAMNDALTSATVAIQMTRAGTSITGCNFFPPVAFQGRVEARSTLTVDSADPWVIIKENDQSPNEQNWAWRAVSKILRLRAYDSALSGSAEAMAIVRGSGTTIESFHFYAPLLANAGTAAVPSFSRRDDQASGVYFPTFGQVGITTAGTIAALWGASGTLLQEGPIQGPNGTVNAPTFSFQTASNSGMFKGPQGVSIADDGLEIIQLSRTSGSAGPELNVENGNFGTGSVTGARLVVGANFSGSGAPGILSLRKRLGLGGAEQFLWVDTSNLLRIGSTLPTEVIGDTGGTVVGAQTCTLDLKTVLSSEVDTKSMLTAVLETPIKRFKYRNGAFNDTEFMGPSTDDAPWIGMDPDKEHPHGRSLNTVNLAGHMVASVKELQAQLTAVSDRLTAVEGAVKVKK